MQCCEVDMTSRQSENPHSPSSIVNVQYNVINDGVTVAKLKIAIPQGSSAQNVMEMGADLDKRLRFQVQYHNNEVGYLLNRIDNTTNWPPGGPGHFWILYVGRGNDLQPSPVGISYWIPPPNSTVELRYEHRPQGHSLHGSEEDKKDE